MFGLQSLSFRRIARAFRPRGRASALRHLALGSVTDCAPLLRYRRERTLSLSHRRPWFIGVFSAGDVLTVLISAECS
jgi:hypothetical protein